MASATALMNRLQPLQLSAVAQHHRAAACICTSKSVMITRHLGYFQSLRRTIPNAIFTDNGAIPIPIPMADLSNDTPNPAREFNFNGRTQNNNEDSTRIPATTKTKSSILVIGLSVHTAPVELREKLAIPAAEWPRAIQALCSLNHISEAAVLSTCNRIEIYVMALSWPRGISEVTDWISQNSGGVPAEDLKPHLFILRDTEAYQHLFQVSSGLDSLVLGEGQILAQLKQVYKIGHEVAGFGRHIGGLFKHAISAGKRVRTETSIAAGAISVSAAAVELGAMKLVPHDLTISSVNVMVVGAGKMGRLVIKHLVSKGCRKITVVNRTLDRVVRLRPEMEAAGAEIMYRPMHELMAAATEAPLIFTSTSSETPLFVKQDVEALLAAASGGSSTRIFIDIAVPRNVGACVSQVAGARLFNVDDLQEVVAANQEDREKKALEAQAIIDEELGRFEAWMDAQETVPTIKMLRAYADRIRSLELEKCLSKLEADSSPEKVKKLMEDLSRGILNKFLHGPMLHLRCDESEGRPLSKTIENMHAVQRMFDLEAPSS